MIVSGQTLRQRKPLSPFTERDKAFGMTYGVGPAGYDVRVAEGHYLAPGAFALASTWERFTMPNDMIAFVHDKSTWARLGLAVQNTVIEPGWDGFLTLELTNHGIKTITLERGMPIAQIVFHFLDKPTEMPYRGKYQNQEPGPQAARMDK